MNWKEWALKEIKRARLYDEDSMYEGSLGKCLEELVDVFSKQDHSGFSASIVSSLFYRLTGWKPLTPITNDLSEWEEIRMRNGEKLYQSKRCPSLFATESMLKENKAKDIDYWYKKDKDGVCYTDHECHQIVDLPYLPSARPKLKNE